MELNKKSEAWRSAPWYVRVGALGFGSSKSIKTAATVCACLGFLAPLVSFWLFWSVSYYKAYVAMAFTSFGLSAYLYMLVLLWIVQNKRELTDQDA